VAHTARRTPPRDAASASPPSGVLRIRMRATRPSRSFQIAPSSTKCCRFTVAAIRAARPASKGTRPRALGAKSREGTVQTAAPASSALTR
jgi:hypothetical protein